MSPREKSFWWKIAYLVAIAVLLVGLYFVGTPATPGAKGSGGKLARLRAHRDYNLSQEHLGQIDATSETIKLATLGLRGVAANILWGKAHLYKKKKDWTNLDATVNQITKLQPHFISVWIFQGWNQSYNVSAEHDSYRDRYHWVKEGVKFLVRGTQYNDREPRLLWEVGWVLSQKIGRADESKQFRLLFKEDDDFHNNLPDDVKRRLNKQFRLSELRDNWLVGREYFNKATDMVDNEGVKMTGKGPLIYRSSGPMCLMNYAGARANEGRYGEVTQQAWAYAAREWFRYGSVDIETTRRRDDGRLIPIRLNDLEKNQAKVDENTKQLDALEAELRKKISEEKRATLTEEQRRVLDDVPESQRTGKQQAIAAKAEEILEVTHEEVFERLDRKTRPTAVQHYREMRRAEEMASLIRLYREIVNFEYWRLRANVEQTDEAMDAHELIYLGDQAKAAGRLDPAKRYFDEGMIAWRKVLDNFPEALTDATFGEDLMEVIQRYRDLLDLLDEKKGVRDATFGEDVVLFDVVLSDVGSEFQDELDRGEISARLRREFEDQEIPLSDEASVSTEEKGTRWSIDDGTAVSYKVGKKTDALNVLAHFILADVVKLHGKEEAGSSQ